MSPKAKAHRHQSRSSGLHSESDNLRAPELYINRELSWLEFNRRVLEEALDPSNRLLERVKFLAIFASNLDEFFMVRVSGLKSQLLAGDDLADRDGLTSAQQVAAIRMLTADLSQRQYQCWDQDLLPRLREAGIVLERYADLSETDQHALTRYFAREIFPVLTPLAVDSGHPFPHISSLTLNMLIVIDDNGVQQVARMKIPPVLPRFVPLPVPHAHAHVPARGSREQRFVLLEDVIEANVQQLFPGKRVIDTHLFRVIRDADIDLRAGTSESLLKAIEEELERRLFGFVVRVTVESSMPQSFRTWLSERLNVPPEDVYEQARPLRFADLMELYDVDRPDLKDAPFTPRYPAELRDAETMFDTLRHQDVLLYHPYDSFMPVVDFVRRSAIDNQVLAIKQTLYRVGPHSPIVDALREARDDETQIAVLVELRARFDEESNINWAKALEQEGVHVAYGLPGLKTHCKIALVVRREEHGLQRYAHLGTGNYNHVTSKIYTDLGLLTADEDIAADVSDIFNYLTGYSSQTTYRKLLVAPVNLRERLTALIRTEATFGREGRIIMKMNSLSDFDIIEELYRASQAGVKIDLIVRGICCLRPGVPGVSETINVISIIGRFLEHARIFYFGHAGADTRECIYVGSADLMRRNLDYRVEVLFPIEDPHLRTFLHDDILAVQLRDNTRARDLQRDGSYVRRIPKDGEARIDSQSLHDARERSAALRAMMSDMREA